MERRIDHLVNEGLARRQGQRVIFARDLLDTLRRRELDAAAAKISADTARVYHASAVGEHVNGVYRQRLSLSSGRFAMIDDGFGFQLVPWRPALDQHQGKQVNGVIMSGGEWTGRSGESGDWASESCDRRKRLDNHPRDARS